MEKQATVNRTISIGQVFKKVKFQMIALAIFLAYFGHFGYLGISFVSFGHPLEQDNVSSTYVSHLQRFGQHAKWIIVDLPSSKCFLTILHQTMTPWSSEDAIRLCQQYFLFILSSCSLERKKQLFGQDLAFGYELCWLLMNRFGS